MQKEIWKNVPIEPYTCYQVSNKGRVRRKYKNNRYSFINPFTAYTFKYKNGKKIKETPNYSTPRVKFSYKGKTRNFVLGRIILQTFQTIPEYNEKQVHHIDGNPFNNAIENLMWLSQKEHLKLEVSKKSSPVYIKGRENPSYKGDIGIFTLNGTLISILTPQLAKETFKINNISKALAKNKIFKDYTIRRIPKDIVLSIGQKYDIQSPPLFYSKDKNNSQLKLELQF
jgi:hypothetical protein